MLWHKIAAIALCGNLLLAETLHLKTRAGALPQDVEGYRANPARRRSYRKSHVLLQFNAPVSQADRDELSARGAVITGVVPDYGLMLAAGDGFTTEGLDLHYAGRLRPEDKISPALATLSSPDDASEQNAYLVEFHSDIDPTEASSLLTENKLTLIDHPDLMAGDFLVTGPLDAVKELAAWDEVAYVFPASPEMVSGQRMQACAGALTNGGAIAQYVTFGHGWSADASGAVNLSYFFSTLTNKVPVQTTKSEIVAALTEWTKYANIHFTESSVPDGIRSVKLTFAAKDHGDGFPFDGVGGVLAHTFYPSNPEPIAGDIHLDGDENWHAGSNTDIYTVALHEAGHALGLAHSDKPGAIMYPYYRFGAKISDDDIAGLQALYGALAPANPTLISIDRPSPNVQTVASTVAMAGTISGGAGLGTVSWQTDRGNSGKAVGTANWSVPSVPLALGANTITVTATDSTHQTVSQSILVNRTAPAVADLTPPYLAITTPAFTIVQTSNPKLTVSGTASDNVEVFKVKWANSIGSSGEATGTRSWVAEIPLLPGTNNLTFRAYDTAGNSSWRSLTVIRR